MKTERGFTLIEMMVAVTIFSIVMMIGVGALLSLITVNARAQAINSVIGNLDSSLETMARNLRTGTTYHCGSNNITTPLAPQNCTSSPPNKYLTFMAADGTQLYYRWNSAKYDLERSPDGTNWVAITAPEVTIDNFSFYVVGSLTNDGIQPRILIYVHGSAKVPGGTTTFTVQTGVTQRFLDVAPST